jgi:ribosomal protein S12 methylthiotransferase accessory factor YcaO
MSESDRGIEIETGVIDQDRETAMIDAVREAAQGRESIEEIVAARIEIGSATAIEATRN